jgi:hypothetical protein
MENIVLTMIMNIMLKILLSEILSKKRVKNKSNITDFGTVEDDGLGRTSLLLKIVGKGEVAKVSYDMKAAGTEVKNNFKKEKQTLKTILNQEYGWYKNDSTVNQNLLKRKHDSELPGMIVIQCDRLLHMTPFPTFPRGGL